MPRPNHHTEGLSHINRIEKYIQEIEDILNKANKRAAQLAKQVEHMPGTPFLWKDYPETRKRIDDLMRQMHNNIQVVILNGEKAEWAMSNKVNDELAAYDLERSGQIRQAFGSISVYEGTRFARYFNRNEKALEAFKRRKVAGMNLSQRVWRIVDQHKENIELGLSLGLSEGRSAAQIAREVKKNLNEPNRLFRRVRELVTDADGNTTRTGRLVLSRAVQAYHPGQGVYRSSYQSAFRLARTEINMAYRSADQERWAQFDFVVGYRIRRSNNPYPCPVCESLVGDYPKSFVWAGWYPNCRCVSTPILKSVEEFEEDEERIAHGKEPKRNSQNSIKDVPENFKKWVSENSERIAHAEHRGATPYFLKDNPRYVDLSRYQLSRSQQVVANYRDEYLSYNPKKWRKDYFNRQNGGFVVTDNQRIEHAGLSKNEQAKFDKELSMAKVFAQSGYRMELQGEQSRSSSYDVRINGVSADFKRVSSHNNVVKYGKKATREQGADMVLFQFDNETDALYKELSDLKRAGIRAYYFFTDRENQVFKL